MGWFRAWAFGDMSATGIVRSSVRLALYTRQHLRRQKGSRVLGAKAWSDRTYAAVSSLLKTMREVVARGMSRISMM